MFHFTAVLPVELQFLKLNWIFTYPLSNYLIINHPLMMNQSPLLWGRGPGNLNLNWPYLFTDLFFSWAINIYINILARIKMQECTFWPQSTWNIIMRTSRIELLEIGHSLQNLWSMHPIGRNFKNDRPT